MKRQLVLVVLSLTACLALSARAQEIGLVNRESVTTSLVAILATPFAYHERAVRTYGVIYEVQGEVALFLNKEHGEHFISPNALWVEFTNSEISIEQVRNLHGEYVIIEGYIDAEDKGSMGIFSATLKRVNRIRALGHALEDGPR